VETADRTIRYLFFLAVLLMLLAYYVGAKGLFGAIFSGVNQLGLTFTGRTSSGQFAAYPK
jgi:hypothetical protein